MTDSSEFSINPCKGCWDTYGKEYCNINTINSCVTETAAAFSGIPSNNFIRGTDADTNWKECMVKMMAAQGRDPCDFQLSMAPVWTQNPHYFPNLLYTTRNPDTAHKKCIEMCKDDKYHKGECIRNCHTDHASVVPTTKESYGVNRNKSNINRYKINMMHVLLLVGISAIALILLYNTMT